MSDLIKSLECARGKLPRRALPQVFADKNINHIEPNVVFAMRSFAKFVDWDLVPAFGGFTFNHILR